MILFSVVTPTLNQAAYIEKTIVSVLDQRHSSFEHIIVDGGSTDGTIEILKKYPHLKWTSEKDSGRAEALNKGFKHARGEIIAWVNSDDYYLPEAFNQVARLFEDSEIDVVVGRAKVADENGQFMFNQESFPERQMNFTGLLRFWKYRSLPQPSLFFRRRTLERVGYFDEKLHDYPDYDLVLRLSRLYKFHARPDFYSCICLQKNAGSVVDIANGVLEKKLYRVSRPHWAYLDRFERLKIGCSYFLWRPRIAWRAHYEKFAFKHKQHLNREWADCSKTEFFKANIRWMIRNPLEMFCAGIRFFIKRFK